MLQDPFGDPFKLNHGPSSPDIFRRRGGDVRVPRKSEAASEPEPELKLTTEPAEDAAEKESTSEKVVLKNPRWEIEKVGLNEETDI